MAKDHRTKWGKALLVKIHVITGWVIPTGEMLTVLVDQFEKKLFESFPNFNPDEIEFAFRQFGTHVQDWGKQMNLAMIDEVMQPYMNRRYELSQIEEKTDLKKLISYKEDLGDQAMQSWYEEIILRVKNIKTYSVEFIPLQLYEWLDAKKRIQITVSEKKEYLTRAANYRLAFLQEIVGNDPAPANQKKLAEFSKSKLAGEFVGDDVAILKNLAKKMVLYDMVKLRISEIGDHQNQTSDHLTGEKTTISTPPATKT